MCNIQTGYWIVLRMSSKFLVNPVVIITFSSFISNFLILWWLRSAIEQSLEFESIINSCDSDTQSLAIVLSLCRALHLK